MEVNNTRKLYDALKSDGYTDLGDFSSFEGKLKDSGKREMLYDVLKKDGWQDLGDFSQFESKLGYAPINNENIKETDYVSQSSVNPPPISLRQEVDIPKSDQSEYVNPWDNSADYNFESLRKKGKIETATPPPPTEYEKDSSLMNTWAGDAIQKLNAGGADLGAGIFGVLDKETKGLESATGGLIPRGGAFKDISDRFKADAEFSRARSNRYNGKDFTDLWKEGNYMGAIGDIALQGVESLPMSIGAMAATMAGAPAAGLAGIGSIVASQKYDDLDQNNPNMGEFAKVSNAILTGTAESLSEMLGAGVSKAWMSTLFKTLGKEKAQEAIKRGIMGKMQEFYKKFGMFFEPVNEGIEEVSSTLAENITDKITGADPERDLTDGVLQSFVYGMGGGAYFTGAGALAKGAQYVADKIGGKQAQQPITDSNVTDQGVETPPLLTKSRFAEAEEEGRNMTDPGDIRTASKKMEETRLSLSGMVPGLASTIESYVDDGASEAQVMSLLDGVNADARPLAEDFYADYLRISGLQDRIGEEIDNEVETYVANNITPYVTTNPDGQSIVTTATLSEGNEERPVYVRSIEGDKAVISDNGQDRMVSVKRLSDIVEQDAGHMRRTYEDQLLATRQSELDMTMHHNPKTQLPKPGLIIWNGDNAFILQGQDENGDWIAQPAAYDRETGQVTAKNGSSPAMPITENEILDLQDAIYDAQQVNVVSPENDNVASADAKITSAPPVEDAINQPTSEIETEGAIDQIAQPSNVENPSMVMREDGTPDFVSSGTDMTLDFLHDKYGDKMPRKIEVTRKSFDESLKKASDALEKAQEAYDDAPIGKEDKAEAALIKARQEYEAIKVEADFWANLDDDIKEASKKPGDVIAKEISVMGDPMSGEELAAMMLANGAIKLTRDSYKKETGAGNNETARMFGLFASPEKGGVNIERAGEILELADRENGTNFFDENDTNAGRDAIIEVLSSAHTRGDLIDYVKRNREAIAERERQAEYNAYAEWCEENYHMSPEEYEAYEESMARDFSEKQLTDEERGELDSQIVDEIQAIIDEQNEIDAILAQNKPIENENIEGNDESGGDGLREGGGEVLPREQLDQTGGTGEVEGRESAGPDIDRTDGATQEGSSRGLVPFVAPSPKENENPLDYAERIVEAKRLHDEELKVDTNPSEAQKEAGNYKKGHVKINGFDVSIEQPAGSVRSGKDASGKEWSQVMNNTYGYIRGTESVDGDHIDVFLGPDMNSDMVYVVDQVNTDGSFDEHKVMMGFSSLEDARSAYLSNYEEGWQGLGNITGVALDEFKKWIDSSIRKTKPFSEYKGIKREEDIAPRKVNKLSLVDKDDYITSAERKHIKAFLESGLKEARVNNSIYEISNIGDDGVYEIVRRFNYTDPLTLVKDENGKLVNKRGEGEHVIRVKPTFEETRPDSGIRFRETRIIPEEENIIKKAKSDGSYMKAPNGNPTNLNEKQWVQVRTKAFKEWFGDWENNPEDASKVIDENGEPRVVYHGTYANFNAFDESHLGDVTNLNATNEDWAKTSHIGFWFNDNKIGFYTKHKLVFLNVRNPLEFASMESLVDEMSYYDSGEDFKRSNSDGYDSVIVLEDEEMGGRSYVVFNDNQIKSATENNEDFSFHNDETSKNEAVKQASEIDGAHFRSIGDKDTDNLNNAETIESSINDWSTKFNTPVKVIHDVDDITDTDENMLARKRDSKGWYDTSTGEIVIVSPNSTSVGDAQRTFLHEVVGHHGLRELFGDDFDTFLDNVYRNANEDIRKNIIDRTKGNPLNLREATEEYIAELAERGFDNKTERSLWEKIKDAFLDMLRKAGISLDFKLSDNDLRYILWRSYKNLEQGNLMDVAEDIVIRNRLGLNNINLNENGSIERDIEPEKGKQPSETKGTGRELETIEGVNENGNESERDHIDKPRGVENAIDGTENATDRNGKKTDGQVDNDGDQLDGGDTGDRSGSVRDGIGDERTVIGRAGSENKGRGVGESVREKTDDFAFAEKTKKNNDKIRFREAKAEVEDEEPLNKEMVDAWDKVASSDSFKFKEAMVDSLTAIDEFLKLLAKKTKSKILDYENPYYALIALSSKNKADMDSFDSKFLNPLNEAIRALIGDASEVSKKGLRRTWDWSKGPLRDLVKYVQSKHGIERNRDMSVRDGIETLKAFDVNALSKMGVISDSDLKNAKKTAEKVAEEKGSEAYKKTYDKVLGKELKKGVDKGKAERSAEIAADYRKSFVKSEIYNKEMDKYKEKVTGALIDRWEDSKKDVLNKDLAWDEEQKELDREALSFQWKLGDNSYGVILGKDYSGLSSVFKPSEDGANKDKWLSDAYDFVRDYESTHNMVLVDNLWDKVHNVSEYTLRRQYESGLISKSYMDKNLSRFKYFIPLRGFSDNIASDVYDYIDATEIKMGNPVKTAKGRISEADNPFAGLIHVGYGSITAGNRNLAKQRFLNLASNHDTGGLITIDNIWVRNVGTEENPEWVESIPQIPDNASGEEVAKAVKDHEEMMRELREEGKAELIKGGRSDIPYKTLYDQRSQHQVQVFVGGNRYVMTVNGNPRLAQAVNGLTNPDVKDDLAYVVARNLKTFMAGAFTSKNVAFSFAYLIRDTPYANNSVFVTENFRYFKDFSGNQRRALFGLRSLGRNLYKYRRGEIDISDKEQAIFKEFMDNGGATGYTFVETQKEYAKDLANKLKKLSDGNIGKLSPKELVSTVFECFEFMGNVAELVNRYAAYKTSREHGRSIDRSINDAKEVSVNFNKKGSGKKTKSDKWYINTAAWISEYGRDWVLFFNAAVQSMYKEYSMLRNHPIKGIGSHIAPLIFMGSSVSLLNNLFMPMLFAYLGWDSDDDDRDYFDSLSDHERQNNICIRLTHGRWLKIPLSPELANYFKIGDIIAGQLSGKREVEAMDVVKTGIDMVSPLNINWEYDSWKFALNLLPTVVQPIAQNASNVNFMGNPIYKTSMNKANDYDPEYTKVYRSTSTTMVELSRALNSLTGGDDVKRGTSFNPATWQNILSGYTGGFGTVALGVSDLVLDMLSGENGDMPVSRYPLLSRFLTGGDKDLKLSRMNSIYNKKVVDFVSEMDHDYKGYLKKIQDTSVDDFDRAGYMVKLNQLTGSDDYRRSMVLSQYVKAISDMERFLREVGSDNDSLENQLYELKLQALEIFEDSDE